MSRIMSTADFINPKTKKTYARKDLMCVYWHHNENKEFYLLMKDSKIFSKNTKVWKKQIKQGKLQCLKENCCENTFKLNDRKFYTLTLQYLDDKGELIPITDPFALIMFGRMVTGLSYFFTNKKNRDIVFNYINKDNIECVD